MPQMELFHVHESDCSWEIAFEGDERAEEVAVRITGEAHPLPLLDAGMSLLGLTNIRGNLVVEVEQRMATKSPWLAASPDGADPALWVSRE